LADLQRTVYPHSGHPSPEGRAQDSVSSPAKDRHSANCATQPTNQVAGQSMLIANELFYEVRLEVALEKV